MKGVVVRNFNWREYNGIRIHNVDECSALKSFKIAYCPFDKPSDHKMEDWPINIRLDAFARGLCERLCPHGVGHPDPDSLQYMMVMTRRKSWGVHGCDGCCGSCRAGEPDQ